MRTRTGFLFLLVVLTLFIVCAISSALADITAITPLGDGTVEARWDDGDAYNLVFVKKTGEDYDADLAAYGSFTVPTEEGKTRLTLYILAPGQSYWIATQGSNGTTTPFAYNVGRPTNFNEWNTQPKIAAFELKKRDANGNMSNLDYYLASDLEDLNSWDSYGFHARITWPQLSKPRTYFWQFIFTLPDGYMAVYDQAILELPKGGYFWDDKYVAVEDFFHQIQSMRGEVPVGQYTFSLYWSGQHVSSVNFWVR